MEQASDCVVKIWIPLKVSQITDALIQQFDTLFAIDLVANNSPRDLVEPIRIHSAEVPADRRACSQRRIDFAGVLHSHPSGQHSAIGASKRNHWTSEPLLTP